MWFECQLRKLYDVVATLNLPTCTRPRRCFIIGALSFSHIYENRVFGGGMLSSTQGKRLGKGYVHPPPYRQPWVVFSTTANHRPHHPSVLVRKAQFLPSLRMSPGTKRQHESQLLCVSLASNTACAGVLISYITAVLLHRLLHRNNAGTEHAPGFHRLGRHRVHQQ